MYSVGISILQKNIQIILVVLLLFFSLMSVYMTHGLLETQHEHNVYESYVSQDAGSKPTVSFKKLLKKIKFFLRRLYHLPQISVKARYTAIINILLAKTQLIYGLNKYFLSFLIFHFYGSKFSRRIMRLRIAAIST